ncbi:alpha/beta fold hydrolase [Aminobacter aminovorans]|uniref:alpha/beta fold hydrolase n=1 Tax=Aminobacter aminovorans TaxID=83263 RepID=UPI0008297C84|nr:alpha/beta hydrolase [Aminobacter aminovorans]
MSIARKEMLVDGLETSYLEAGSGKPLVLLHGGEFGGDAEVCWEYTIPELAKRFRVIAPDLLGFGRTAKIVDFVDGRRRRLTHLARFLELVDAIGAPCVGNSMGGMLLLYDAGSPAPLLRPAKIISIAGGGALASESAHFQSLFSYDGSFAGMRRIVDALFHAPKWAADDSYVERRRQSSLAPGAWEAVAAARFRRPVEVQEARTPSEIAYEKVSVPTLVIAGADDKLKPKGWQTDVANAIPGARSVLVADAGHCPQIEQPAITNEVLIRFLTEG